MTSACPSAAASHRCAGSARHTCFADRVLAVPPRRLRYRRILTPSLSDSTATTDRRWEANVARRCDFGAAVGDVGFLVQVARCRQLNRHLVATAGRRLPGALMYAEHHHREWYDDTAAKNAQLDDVRR